MQSLVARRALAAGAAAGWVPDAAAACADTLLLAIQPLRDWPFSSTVVQSQGPCTLLTVSDWPCGTVATNWLPTLSGAPGTTTTTVLPGWS